LALQHDNVRDTRAIEAIWARATSGWVASRSRKPHFGSDFVTILEEPPRGADADLQVVLIGAGSQTHLVDF